MAKTNTTLRIIYLNGYTSIARQFGKIAAKETSIMLESDLDVAIAKARSIRGHMAVILKELHAIRRAETLYERIGQRGEEKEQAGQAQTQGTQAVEERQQGILGPASGR